MKNLIKYTLALGIAGFFTQSCEKQGEATYMDDFLVAEEFVPDWTDNLSTMDKWETLPNDGESGAFYPYSYSVIDNPAATITRIDVGIKYDSYDEWWDQRFVREGFDVAGDFEIEFEVRMLAGTAVWQKTGIFVGEVGGSTPKIWLSLEGPVGDAKVNIHTGDGTVRQWYNADVGNFDVYDWQVIKAVRVGNKLTIYRNGNIVDQFTDDVVLGIEGKVGISAEGISAEFKYLKVNGVVDDFSSLDNADMGNWSNLVQHDLDNMKPSVWTPSENGLNVVANSGWNHRALGDAIPENFTVEYKVKINSANSTYPKAGLMIGELGGDAPSMILGLDNNGGGSSIVKFIKDRPGGEWQNFGVSGLDVHKWQTIRIKRAGDNMYIYINGIREYYEKGDYVANMQGRLGFIVEGCDTDYEFISYKTD